MLALQKSLELAMHPIFFTNNPQRYAGLEKINCPTCVCDTNALEILQSTVDQLVPDRKIAGVITMSEFYLETVAALSARYQTPGNPPDAIRKARNKLLTRQLLLQEAIHQPRFMGIQDIQLIDAALEHVGLPCIIKPVDDSGSNDVLLCQTREQAREQAAKILATPINVRGQRTAGIVLVEEYVDAPEFSVEMFSQHGQTTCIGITQKSLTGLPYFSEARHIFPAPLVEEQEEQIRATVLRTLTALGIRHGATHTEVKWTRQGCAIIEVNARLAGGMIPELIRLVTGVDMLEQQLCSAVDRPVSLQMNKQGVAGIQFLTAEKKGVLRAITGIEAVTQIKNIVATRLTARPGIFVQPPQNAYHRLGYVIAYSESAEETIASLKEALQHIHLAID